MSEKSEKDKKAFQSYLDNIKAKTGKTPEDFRKLAKKKGLVKPREIVAWLKEEYGLGYGHAGAIYYVIVHADDVKASTEDRIEKRFQAAGTWNNMVTHRVRFSDPKQIDAEVLTWLKDAYDNQKEKTS